MILFLLSLLFLLKEFAQCSSLFIIYYKPVTAILGENHSLKCEKI